MGYRVGVKAISYTPFQWLRLLFSTSWDLTTLFTAPVPDEDMLPEARKEIAESMWEIFVINSVDCIFEDTQTACK